MSQSVYSGLQGHGKSYEFVRSVVVPSIARGLRVVTNVAGLQYDKICDYCVERLGADRDKLGTIVTVSHEDISKPNFFPLEEDENPYRSSLPKYQAVLSRLEGEDKAAFLADLEEEAQKWRDSFIVKGGDVIGIDECWRWYATGCKLPDGHLKFFRMHRHFLHPVTGQCCEIVLIVQDIDSLQRLVRATVEKSFLMQKHIDLGMPDRYVINVYSGNRQTKRALLESYQCKYDPAIFELYKSHSQARGAVDPKEERADRRGSLWNRKIIRYGLPVAVVWIGCAVFFMWRFFHPADKAAAMVSKSGPSGGPSAPGGVGPALEPKQPGVSDRWRLVGYFLASGSYTFVLADASGAVRYITEPPGFKFSRAEVEIALPDRDVVTRWSGGKK